MQRILPLLVLALTACGGGARLSLSARAGSTASTMLAAPGSTVQALTLTNGITVDRVRLAIREVKLEREGGDPANDADDQEYESGPVLLDLTGDALAGNTQMVAISDVPAGTYTELKFKIQKPDLSDPGVSTNAELTAMAQAGVSVIVDGTIDGAQFTFTSSLDVEQEFQGSFVVASGAANVTLNLDPSGWFGGSGSARLDPRVDANRSQIENDIRASMRAFEDNDRDGVEDP